MPKEIVMDKDILLKVLANYYQYQRIVRHAISSNIGKGKSARDIIILIEHELLFKDIRFIVPLHEYAKYALLAHLTLLFFNGKADSIFKTLKPKDKLFMELYTTVFENFKDVSYYRKVLEEIRILEGRRSVKTTERRARKVLSFYDRMMLFRKEEPLDEIIKLYQTEETLPGIMAKQIEILRKDRRTNIAYSEDDFNTSYTCYMLMLSKFQIIEINYYERVLRECKCDMLSKVNRLIRTCTMRPAWLEDFKKGYVR